MTKLKFLNYIVQIFFIRICKHVDKESKQIIGWSIIYWIVPFTGWNSSYLHLGTFKIKKLTKFI